MTRRSPGPCGRRGLAGLLCAVPLLAAAADPAADAPLMWRLLQQDCGSCHGLHLDGGLGPDLRPAALRDRDDETLFRVIRDGLPGTAMPGWAGLLEDAEIRQLVQLLRAGSGSESP